MSVAHCGTPILDVGTDIKMDEGPESRIRASCHLVGSSTGAVALRSCASPIFGPPVIG